MSRRILTAAFLLLLVTVLHAQTAFRGTGKSDIEALEHLCAEVADAYASSLPRRMAFTYIDELRSGSSRSENGSAAVREISRNDVESIFLRRKEKAEAIVNGARTAESGGDPGRARMYYHWAAALYMSLPGNNDARVRELQARRDSLKEHPFPKTGANNVGVLAEKIYAAAKVAADVTAKEAAVAKKEVKPDTPVTVKAEPEETVAENAVEEKAEPDVEPEPQSESEPESEPDTLPDAVTAMVKNVTELDIPAHFTVVESEAAVPESEVEAAVMPIKRERFIIMAGAGVLPDLTAQARFAWMPAERIGVYISGSGNFSMPGYEYGILRDGTIISDGAAGTFWGSGNEQTGQWNVSTGIIWTPFAAGRSGFYAGAGYVERRVTATDIDGVDALVSDLSYSGPCAEAGLIFLPGRLAISAGTHVSCRCATLDFGVGVRF